MCGDLRDVCRIVSGDIVHSGLVDGEVLRIFEKRHGHEGKIVGKVGGSFGKKEGRQTCPVLIP